MSGVRKHFGSKLSRYASPYIRTKAAIHQFVFSHKQPYKAALRTKVKNRYDQGFGERRKYYKYQNHKAYATKAFTKPKVPKRYKYRISPASITTPREVTIGCANCQTNSIDEQPQVKSEVTDKPDTSLESELTDAAKDGISLLKELLQNLKQEAETNANTDPEEVAAVKSLFSDIFDEIIQQIELGFKEDASKGSDMDSLLSYSKETRKAIDGVQTQAELAILLEPYVTEIVKLIDEGFQAITTP